MESLGLPPFLEQHGCKYITTADQDGPNSGAQALLVLLSHAGGDTFALIIGPRISNTVGDAISLSSRLLPETDILITTPFHPCYMTKERFDKAENLELCITAGVGSDHYYLHTAANKGITVAEVLGFQQQSTVAAACRPFNFFQVCI